MRFAHDWFVVFEFTEVSAIRCQIRFTVTVDIMRMQDNQRLHFERLSTCFRLINREEGRRGAGEKSWPLAMGFRMEYAYKIAVETQINCYQESEIGSY